MPARLTKMLLTEEMRRSDEVQKFNCGDDPWAETINRWLKAPLGTGGAIDEVELASGYVWLYRNESNELVGVGGIAEREYDWPENSLKPIATLCLTGLGVDVKFLGRKLGKAILADLLYEALNRREKYQLLILDVDLENVAAAEWYSRVGFELYGNPYPFEGRFYQKMRMPNRIATE